MTANGLFEFDTPLDDKESYDATILTSPSNQNCTCTYGSGVVSETDITNIEVSCVNKSWTHPTSLIDNISPDGRDASNPQLAMDDNGNAIITWEQNKIDGKDYQIFKSEYRNGVWTHPSNLSDNISPDGEGVYWVNPQVAMNNNGNAVITWYQNDGGVFQIFKSEYQ